MWYIPVPAIVQVVGKVLYAAADCGSRYTVGVSYRHVGGASCKVPDSNTDL